MKSGKNTIDARIWIERGMEAIAVLWDAPLNHAWRTSLEKSRLPNPGPASSAKHYFPTATFHALIALGELRALNGLHAGDSGMPWLAEAKDKNLELPTADSALDRLLNLRTTTTPVSSAKADANWFDAAMGASSNNTDPSSPPDDAPGAATRRLVLLGHAAPALRFLLRDSDQTKVNGYASKLRVGMERLAENVGNCFRNKKRQFLDATAIAEYPYLSPYLVMNAAVVFDDYATFDRILSNRTKSGLGPLKKYVGDLPDILRQYFTAQVERLMARRSVHNDPVYDDASLAFAVRGLLLLSPEFRTHSLFRAAVEAVAAGQLDNGCWPSAVSVAFSTTGDVLQQPSVEVALSLAATVFDPASAVGLDSARTVVGRSMLPALRRTLGYLAATYTSGTNESAPGWASDRTRPKNHVEMWVNSLATRLAYHVLRLERVCERARILSTLSAAPPRKAVRTDILEEDALRKQWDKRIAEPELITKPANTLLETLVLPVWQRRWLGDLFVKPPKDGTSFIVYGPPGSGKTYAVKRLAEVLEWPLVSLSPGWFIRDGLEGIEAAAGKVFRKLMRLDHAVVLFDECDELFRDRDSADPAMRNILSFVTASMLPKLQDLHDNRRAVFVLATNYLSRIDKAVRRVGRFDHVLLFDRPGPEARRAQIGKILSGRNPPISPRRVSVTAWVDQTAGFVFDDLARFVGAQIERTAYTKPEITDYLDWCIDWGAKELDASPLPTSAKNALVTYWGKLPGYADRLAEKQSSGAATVALTPGIATPTRATASSPAGPSSLGRKTPPTPIAAAAPKKRRRRVR